MKRAAIYARASTPEQHVETQLYDLRQLTAQRGFEVVAEFTDNGVSGTKARRHGLDSLMADARKRKFSVVLVAAFDRVARSTKHFLQVMDEFDDLGIEFVSRRENVDTRGPMGRLFLTLIGSIAALESELIRERIKAGMRRRKLEGYRIGRQPLNVDRAAIVRDRLNGMSLMKCSKKYGVSRASVIRFVRAAQHAESEVNVGNPMIAEQTTAVKCIASREEIECRLSRHPVSSSNFVAPAAPPAASPALR
jgi:DNA invertase Pin-like site-specific DNA recombinase